MSTNSSATAGASGTHVTELLEQRSRIQSWLDNLETVGAEANTRVVERVRTDYTKRLGSILDELAGHLESIRSDREKRQQELTSANRRLEEASEELEEARLRHMIGEISDEEWRDRQPDLGDAVTQAEADREDARAEVERLDDLLRQIEETPGDDHAADGHTDDEEAEPADEDVAGEEAADELAERMVDLDEAGTVDAPPEVRPDQALSSGGGLDDDDSDLRIVHAPDPLAFLSELPETDESTVEQPAASGRDLDFLRDLDRAISGEDGGDGEKESVDALEITALPADEENAELYRPTPGTKCPECGYTNDPEAWYCGVCGVDLA